MASKQELFTVLVTGKGVRLKARVCGRVAAEAFVYAKSNEAKEPPKTDRNG